MFQTMPFSSRFNVDAAEFDGANDYMKTGSNLGLLASKSGVASIWVRPGAVSGNLYALGAFTTVGGSTSRFALRFGGFFEVFGRNSSGTTILSSRTSALSVSTPYHFLASWDLATATHHMYVNDSSDLTVATSLNQDIAYNAGADWAVGAQANGAGKYNGAMAELWFKAGVSMDFSVAANRRKFIDGQGRPVFPGRTGERPGLGAPDVYCHIGNNEAVANFALNRGGGTNLSITGTLATASWSPSD